MGLIEDTKVNIAATHAARARQEGRTVFLYRFDGNASSSGFSGPVGGAAEVIESVERTRSRLVDTSVTSPGTKSKNGAALLLFRLSGPR